MKNYALSLTSAFSTTSLLKARVKMLYRKPSTKLALVKFGFVLPALVLCVGVTACFQREPVATQTPQAKVSWVRTVSGEMIESIHFEGEKDAYEKVADLIGLNDFLRNKALHTVEDILKLHKTIVPTALKNGATLDQARRMQGSLTHLLLEKKFGENNVEDFAYLVESLLRNDNFPLMVAYSNQGKWFLENLPKLKNYWTAEFFDNFKQKILNTYQTFLAEMESTKGKPFIAPSRLRENIQFLKNM